MTTKQRHSGVRSWQAFLIGAGVNLFGFVWTSFYPNAPYEIFSWVIFATTIGYITKRIAQKSKMFGGTADTGEDLELGLEIPIRAGKK